MLNSYIHYNHWYFFLFISPDIIILLFIFHHLTRGYHGELCSVINKLTITGYPSNKIGDWPDGCPNGRYIKAVWSKRPTEHFQKIKCCEGASDNTLSWELRDLLYFSGGQFNVTEQWKVQCQSNAVMTGVRYVTKPNGLRILSGIRCSALQYQVIDSKDCIALDFTTPVNDPNFDSTTTKSWQHECPNGYAMVGVYDKAGNKFWNIRKAKCCKLLGKNLIFFIYITPNFIYLKQQQNCDSRVTTRDLINEGINLNLKFHCFRHTIQTGMGIRFHEQIFESFSKHRR